MTATKEKTTSPARDLTEGQPMKLIILFALPMLLGLFLQQFYSLVDSMIVGNYVGEKALAGVGSTGAINFIVLVGLCIGVCNGFSVILAQRYGAKDLEGLRRALANSIWLCMILGGTVTVLVSVFCKPILKLMRTPDNIFEYAHAYLWIIFIGIPFMLLYNQAAGVLRALGDSRSPLIFLIISAFLNIGLDLLLIVKFGMGTEGAAIATVFSQGFSGVLCIVYIKKKFPILKMKRDEMRPDKVIMKNLLSVGLPMGLQYSITGIGSVILQASVNGLGDSAIAAITAAQKVQILLACPLDGLGQAMAPFAGQNVGAKKIDRVGQGLKSAVICGMAVSLMIVCICAVIGRTAVSLFLDKTELTPDQVETILNYGTQFLFITACFDPLLALVNTVRFTIQGMGFSNFAMLAGVLEMIARSLVGLFLIPLVGFIGACFAGPLAWVFADAFLIPAYFHCKKVLSSAQ